MADRKLSCEFIYKISSESCTWYSSVGEGRKEAGKKIKKVLSWEMSLLLIEKNIS